MKVIIIIVALLIISMLAFCMASRIKNGSVADDDVCGGIPPPMSVIPFWDVSLWQGRSIGLRRRKTSNGYESKKFIALILEDEMNEKWAVEALGFDRKKDSKRWRETYFGILLKAHDKDAKELIEQYNIQGFPATIEESRSVDGKEIFSKVWYGYLPQVSGNNEIDARPIANKMFQKFRDGDRDKQLIWQLRDHLDLLELAENERNLLERQLVNEYLNQFSKEELSTPNGYRLLKRELKDVRYDVIQKVLKDSIYYNEVFRKIVLEKNLKGGMKHDANWIIERAILKSFERAAQENDDALYEAAMAVRNQYEPDHMTLYLARAILEFQIKQGSNSMISEAALSYFEMNKNWRSSKTETLEAAAIAVHAVSNEKKEWERAERWIARALETSPNPTRYRLHAELLKKLDREEEVLTVLANIYNYKQEFEAFKNFYPLATESMQYLEENISKEAYKQLKSIPAQYKTFYNYIARESSIYKKGQKIEPIALLSQDENQIEILTRVHLMTGSILPVSHIRSYYIRSVFKSDGEHLRSEYFHSTDSLISQTHQ